MILDRELRFSSAQTIAFAVGTAASTDVIDLHMSGIPVLANLQGARDLGAAGTKLKLLVVVIAAATSAGAGTLSVTFQGAPDNGSGAPGTYATWWVSPAYALATLTAGARLMDLDFPRPPAGIAIPRFVRLLYTVGTADLTGGTVSAWVALDREDQMYNSTNNAVRGGYPAGINIAN